MDFNPATTNQTREIILCCKVNITLWRYIINGYYEEKLTVNYLLLLNFGLLETKITTNYTELFPGFKDNN